MPCKIDYTVYTLQHRNKCDTVVCEICMFASDDLESIVVKTFNVSEDSLAQDLNQNNDEASKARRIADRSGPADVHNVAKFEASCRVHDKAITVRNDWSCSIEAQHIGRCVETSINGGFFQTNK